MGKLTGEELVDEVRSLVGREGSNTQGTITDVRVTRWINECQRRIAEECPGLPELEFRNPEIGDSTSAATHTLVTDQIDYAISDLTFAGGPDYNDVTDESVVFIWNVWHVDGANSIKLRFFPTDEFDEFMIDPTSSEVVSDRPSRWTRRGDNIEIAPRPTSTYNGDILRVDGMRTPQEFTTTDTTASELKNADEGIIYYATGKAWGSIGGLEAKVEADSYMRRFSNPHPTPTQDFGWLERYRDAYSRMEAWDANLFSDTGGSSANAAF